MSSKKFESREYQQDAVSMLTKCLSSGAKLIYQLPTGGGKTYIATQVCKMYTDKAAPALGYKPMIYWVTHRRELELQSSKALAMIGIYNFKVSSPIRFFNKIKRKEIFPGEHNLLIVDECHHATAPTWERLISNWEGPVLGLTATPWRLSKKEGFKHLFNELECGPTIQELIDQQYLVPCLLKSPPNKIKGYGNIGGEYSTQQIMEKNSRGILIENAIQWLVKEMDDQSRVLVYACGVEHCEILKQYAYDEFGLYSEVLLGKTPVEERDKIVRDFSTGRVKILMNFNVLTEGFDVPEADMALILRPTQSLSLYLQMIGRVIRKSENKLYSVVLDSTDNYIVHGLPEEDRDWTLEAREDNDSARAGGFIRKCVFCEAILHAAKRECNFCHNELGFKCNRCGKFSWWDTLSQSKLPGNELKCELCNEEAQNTIFKPSDTGDHVLPPVLLGGEYDGQIGAIYIGKEYPNDLLPGTRIVMQYSTGQVYDHIKQELGRKYNQEDKTWKMIYSTWKNHQTWVLQMQSTIEKGRQYA